jgi:hypothetical protein
MKNGKILGAGFCLLVGFGCANQGKSGAVSSSRLPHHSTQQDLSKPVTTQPTEEPKWEASSTPAELLAQKTAAYAQTLQSSETADQGGGAGAIAPEASSSSAALLGQSRRHRREEAPAAPAEVIPPVPVQPVAPPLVVPPASVATVAGSDGPKIMPESADFAIADSASKDALGTRLRKRTQANPHDIADQLDLQLYGMLNDDPSPELASVSELPDDDRELVAALIDGISNFRSTVREDGNMLQAKKIQPLLDMADRLRSQADLTVSTVALCRRVDGFGKYEPISPLRFPAMQENAAIVYCEVQNFLTREEGSMWKTKLTEQVTLYSDMGVLAWSDDKREVNDECRNRRHDFFAYNIIRLPSTLTVGRYVLKVTIEDKNADRVAEATVPVEIVAK